MRLSDVARLGALALLLMGCERGCLMKRITAARSGADTPASAGSAWSGTGPAVDLTGTDCSDGLLRCRNGVVEASRKAVIPHPCTPGAGGGPAEPSCECPWDAVARCRAECAVDDLEVLHPGSIDAGKMQLCRTETPVARPILPSDAVSTEVCAAEGVRCTGGVVQFCDGAGRPSRPYAYCLRGCSGDVGIDDETSTWAIRTADGAVTILCRHDDAERR